MTPKQHALWEFIKNYTTKNGYSPNFEEMKTFMGLKSKSGIHRLIKELESQNIIIHTPHQHRGLALAEIQEISNENCTQIPLYGKIAAGLPIEAVADTNNKITVPNDMIGNGEYYALKVEGDSMINAGIMAGDTVIIHHTERAQNGQIVVALIDEYEVTLKKFYHRNNTIALEPANPAYETRIFAEDRVHVQGILAGLMRQYEGN